MDKTDLGLQYLYYLNNLNLIDFLRTSKLPKLTKNLYVASVPTFFLTCNWCLGDFNFGHFFSFLFVYQLLDALELSQSPLLLRLMAGILCRDRKHIMEEQFQTCFQRIAERLVKPSQPFFIHGRQWGYTWGLFSFFLTSAELYIQFRKWTK